MATQAAFYEEMIARPEETAAGTGPRPVTSDSFRVRTFPNEDICLWQVRIDNSRVQRHADPQVWNACWRSITVALLAAIVIVGLVMPGAYNMLAGYRLQKLNEQRAELLEQRRLLEIEESRLVTPQRLEELSEMQKFEDPTPNSVVYLEPKNEQSLAAYRSDKH